MALIAVKVPTEISKVLRSIDVDGDRDPSDHITMFYIEGEMSPNDVSKACKILQKAAAEFGFIDATIKKITTFPKGDDGVPIKADVISPDLHELRLKLGDLLDAAGIKYSKKFKEYNPHITLSYNKKKIKPIKLEQPIKWIITELMLWSGDTRDYQGTSINFPLYKKISAYDQIVNFSEKFSKLLLKD